MNYEIKELIEALHTLAGNQPGSDPFASCEGAQEWQEWSQSCRAVEEALTNAGVEL